MTADNPYISLLNQTNLFAGISHNVLSAIAEIANEQTCEENEVLYRHGDDTIDFFALISGSVRFKFEDRSGTLTTEGAIMRSRMIFGWAALVPDHPRRIGSAHCEAPSKMLVINGDQAMLILRSDPTSGLLVMERLCAMVARSFMDQR